MGVLGVTVHTDLVGPQHKKRGVSLLLYQLAATAEGRAVMVDTPCSLAWIGAPAARGEPEERPYAAAAENAAQTLKKEPRGRPEVVNTKLDVCGSFWTPGPPADCLTARRE